MRIETAFELGDSVNIIAHDIEGIVNAFWMLRSGVLQYEIEWSDNDGVIHTRYFIEKELQRIV